MSKAWKRERRGWSMRVGEQQRDISAGQLIAFDRWRESLLRFSSPSWAVDRRHRSFESVVENVSSSARHTAQPLHQVFGSGGSAPTLM